MAQPRLLLLDGSLLGWSLITDEIFDIIKQLSRGGVTILLVEQNAARLHRLPVGISLANGRIVGQGLERRTPGGPGTAPGLPGGGGF